MSPLEQSLPFIAVGYHMSVHHRLLPACLPPGGFRRLLAYNVSSLLVAPVCKRHVADPAENPM